MARKNPAREALLQQVLARQRAAGKKVSRLRGQGIDLAGTENDPRKPAKLVRTYTTKQLEAQLYRLNHFTSRKTQFALDAHGRLLLPGDIRDYKLAEKRINAAKKKVIDKIGHIVAPGAGNVTIKQRLKIITPDRPHAGNPAVNPFVFTNRKPNAFTSARALRKLTADLNEKLSSDFLAKDLAKDREVAAEMLSTLRMPDMQAKLDSMSDFHFNILWNFTQFATNISFGYEIAREKLKTNKPKESWYEDKLSENLEHAGSLVNAVEKIKLRR